MEKNRKHSLWAATALLLVLGLLVPWTALANVWTDREDYSPGDTVTIYGDNSDGAGFLAGEAVHVEVSGPNGYTAACDATADGDGAWSCQTVLWPDSMAVGTYDYTATGQSSGVAQSRTLTDAGIGIRFYETGLPEGQWWGVDCQNCGGPQWTYAPASMWFDIPPCSYVWDMIYWAAEPPILYEETLDTRYEAESHYYKAPCPWPFSMTEYIHYITEYLVGGAVSPAGGGSATMHGIGYDAYFFGLYIIAGEVVPLSATANTGYAFSSWTASKSGITFADASSASTTATVNGSGTITANFVLADSTAPATSIALNPEIPGGLNGWYASNVGVAVSAADNPGGSGVAETRCVLDPAAAPASFDDIPAGCAYTGAGANVTTEGQHIVYAASKDSAGNKETPASKGFKIDKTAPQLVSCDAPDGAWHANNVTLYCTYTDGGSGPASQQVSLSTSVASGDENQDAIASAGGAKACDNAGNCAASPADIAGNRIDRKAPQLSSCDSPDTLWHVDNVTLKCTYTDGGSGLASQQVSLSTSVAAGDENANAIASAGGAKACDFEGNCAASPADIAGNKVDRKAPSITITTPSSGATYTLNQAVAASYSCTDGGSGMASCSGPVANGSNIDTASVGSKSFKVDATDKVGNSASSLVSYKAIYNWTGFFQPVDIDKLNTAKAGSAIPVKFSLSGNQGLNIFATGYPRTISISCAPGEAEDQIEEMVDAGGSSLNYDPTADQYIYVWKTDKNWAGTCRQLQVTLVDGTPHTAGFGFK